eukprot:1366127-Amphidinium_carterae.1
MLQGALSHSDALTNDNIADLILVGKLLKFCVWNPALCSSAALSAANISTTFLTCVSRLRSHSASP